MNSGEWSRQRALSRIGELVKGKWRIESLVGIGGTAAVYAATHRNGLRAAIKLLRPELAAYTEVVTRFVREGYAANRVGHPGVVQVLDDDVAEDGAPFLVMELLEGEPLENYARDPKHLLPLPRALDVVNQVLDVLAAAHAQGILHRDIKPANIFMTYDGRVKVLDFGIARLMQSTHESHTLAGAAIGTPAFMPPEQARGRWNEVDGRTDLWAVGAMAHAMFVGGRPRRAQTAQEELLQAMTTPLPLLHGVAPQVPPQICSVFDTALDFDREARFPDARAMQLALRNACIAAAMPPPTLPTAQFTFGTSDVNAVVTTKTTGSTPALHGASPSNPSSHVTGATGQAVSMSRAPFAAATKTKRTGPLVLGAFMLLSVCGFGVWGAQRYRVAHVGHATSTTVEPRGPQVSTSATASPNATSPAPTAEPSPVAEATTPTPTTSPSTTSPTAAPSASPAPAQTAKKLPPKPSVPAPAKTFNPLDQRF